MPTFADLKSEYENLWATMTIRPERVETVSRIARKLIANKARYQAVAAKSDVPWFVIAALHNRESDADFSTYLGNGETLDRVTRLIPKGRGPFPSWEAGAIDALAIDGFDKVDEWTPARACYEIEKFNGFGYRGKGLHSPYLWSFSNHYARGKYVADGRFDPAMVDRQCGAVPTLKSIMELDGITFGAPSQAEHGKGLLAVIVDLLQTILRLRAKPGTDKTPPAPVQRPPSKPPWLVAAEEHVGFREVGVNRGIESFIRLAKCGSAGDPWCAIFVNACLESVGIRGTRSAMARSFERDANFMHLAGPALGAITTMWRSSSSSGLGHVGFYIGENEKGVLLLGGNQSDEVRRQYEPRARIVGYFWPKGTPQPKVGTILIEDDDAEEGSER